jgi:integrase
MLPTLRSERGIQDLIEIATQGAAPVTKRTYERELRAFLKWFEAHSTLYPEGFCRLAVIGYRDAMLSAGRGPVSVNVALSAIRKLSQEAADRGLMDEARAGRIESVAGVRRQGKRLGNWLTLPQLKDLLAAAPPTTPNRGMRDRTALWIMGACGLRREEAVGLTFGQLQDRDGRTVFVDVLGKGNKLRSVPVHPLAAVAIRQWCHHAGIDSPDAYILPTIDNPDQITTRPADGARLYDACVRYCRAKGMTFRPHDLRRTFAVLAKRGGADYEDIRQALGHASITTTEVYLRAPMALDRAAADKIDL